MRYSYILLLAFIFTGCVKRSIEFTGTAPGVKNGVFIVKTLGDSTLYGENIKDGKFSIPEKLLKAPGYYTLNVIDNDNNDNHDAFEVYLEPGKYNIETEAGALYKYPKITSPSKIQDQLSAFYNLSDKLSLEAQQETFKLNAEIKKKENSSPEEYNKLLFDLSAAQNKLTINNVTAFGEFVKQNPKSSISTHLMEKLNYEDDPAGYYKIYQTLTPEAKNSDEGKEIGDKLSHLIKLVVGVKAPSITGKTPDGKVFDPKSVTSRVILIDFWRASNEFSRRNHAKLINVLADMKDKSKFGVISVSLDTKMDWWTTAVREDKMDWTQVSDLKGDDSPNATNWSVTSIPTYYLLDNNWKIVVRNVDIGKIDFEVTNYLSTHN